MKPGDHNEPRTESRSIKIMNARKNSKHGIRAQNKQTYKTNNIHKRDHDDQTTDQKRNCHNPNKKKKKHTPYTSVSSSLQEMHHGPWNTVLVVWNNRVLVPTDRYWKCSTKIMKLLHCKCIYVFKYWQSGACRCIVHTLHTLLYILGTTPDAYLPAIRTIHRNLLISSDEYPIRPPNTTCCAIMCTQSIGHREAVNQ